MIARCVFPPFRCVAFVAHADGAVLCCAELIKKLRGAAGSVVSSLASATHVLSDQPEVNQRTADVLLAEGRGLPIVGEAFVDACLKMGSAFLPRSHTLRLTPGDLV